MIPLLVAILMAHGEHAEFYRSLTQPGTGASCCSEHDCRPFDDWREVGPGYAVRIEGQWHPVPPDRVLADRPNPTGHAVLCSIGSNILCFLPIGTGA